MTLSGICGYLTNVMENVHNCTKNRDYESAFRAMETYKEGHQKYFPNSSLSEEDSKLEKKIIREINRKNKKTNKSSLNAYAIYGKISYDKHLLGFSVGTICESAIVNFREIHPELKNAGELSAIEVHVPGFKIKVKSLEKTV